MWLVVSLVAAATASAAFVFLREKRKPFKLGLLALMLWGTFIMVLVDHLIAYLEGGPFIEFTTDGLIPDATLLGIAMVLPILIVWGAAVVLGRQRPQPSASPAGQINLIR